VIWKVDPAAGRHVKELAYHRIPEGVAKYGPGLPGIVVGLALSVVVCGFLAGMVRRGP
jgi:hypothetical protein